MTQSVSFTSIDEPIVLQMFNNPFVRCAKCHEENIRLGGLDQHEQKACGQTIASCKAADIKCPWIGSREQLSEPMISCVFEPLRSALAKLINYGKRIVKIKSEPIRSFG